MDALVTVLVDEVLTLRCHENGDCQEPDDRHSERSHVWSEPKSAGGCQSERSRVSSELHCCPDEKEEDDQVIGWRHDQDDVCTTPFIIVSLDLLLLGILDLVLLGLPFLRCS